MALVRQFKTPFGTIRITRSGDGTLAYVQNGCFHSQVNKKGVSICAYTHVMSEIIRQKKARSVLIIGCGGGSVATQLARQKIKVQVVDINPAAFTIARDYFGMPTQVECSVSDGLLFVRKTSTRFDAVVIDVFDSHNNVPTAFTTKAFLGNVRNILKRGGAVIMNVMAKTARDRNAQRIAANMKRAGLPAHICEWSEEPDRNIIIVGGTLDSRLGRVRIPSGKEPDFIQEELDEFAWR